MGDRELRSEMGTAGTAAQANTQRAGGGHANHHPPAGFNYRRAVPESEISSSVASGFACGPGAGASCARRTAPRGAGVVVVRRGAVPSAKAGAGTRLKL